MAAAVPAEENRAVTASPVESPLTPTVSVPNAHRMLAIRATVLGLVAAALSIAGDVPGTLRVLSLAGNIAAPWALAAFVVGLGARSRRAGAVAGGASLVAATVVYYAAYYVTFAHVPGASEAVWLALAVVVGPVAGWCGAVVRGSAPSRERSIAAVVAPALPLAEVAWLGVDRRVWLWGGIPAERAADLAVLVAVAAAGLTVAWRYTPRGTRGRHAVAVALVTTVGAVAFEALHRSLVLL